MKIKNFIKINKEYFLTSAIIFAIVFCLYAIHGIFPLGTNTMAHYDMIAQTIPLSELIYDFFNGTSPLFFTTKIGLGANTFGYLIYFILSPFNILTLIGGQGNIIYAVNIVFLLKLIFIGCIIIWFIKKYFKNLNTIQILILSLLYVFSGYTLFSYTYLSFLDYLIYAPLFIHFFIKLKDEGKIFPLGIIIFLMILSCFSLGCFTLLYLMIIFIGYVFIATPKEQRKTIIIKTACACLIGIGLSMWLLLPALMTYTSSSRKIGLHLSDAPLFLGTSTKIGVIITEIMSFIFAIIYLIKCDKKNSLNKFLFFVVILTILTTICDEIMVLLNGGSIYGYYSRFGFVGTILTLILACKYFNEQFTYGEGKDKFVIFLNYFITFTLLTIFILLLISNYQIAGVKSQKISFYGLYQFLIITSPITLITFYSFITKKRTGKHINTILTILTILLCCFNASSHLMLGINDTTMFASASNLTKNIGNNRVKIYSNSYLQNSGPVSGFYSMDTFSSLLDSGLTNSLYLLGYSNTTNSVKSHSGTLLSDMIIGNKYIISENKLENDYLNYIAYDQFYFYENTYSPNYVKVFSGEIELGDDLIKNQENIYRAFGGIGQLLEKVDIKYTYENCTYNEKDKVFTIIDKSLPAKIIIDNNYDNDTILYAYCNSSEIKRTYINGSSTTKSLVEIFKNKDEFFGDIAFEDTFDLSNFSFYALDTKKLNNLITTSFECEVNYNTISSKVNLKENSSIMLPFIDIDGYSVYVNGEKTEFSNKFSKFMTLDLEKGENNIEIKFNNPIITPFIIGIIIDIGIILLAIFINKYISKFNDKLINTSFNVLSCAYVYITIFIPFVVMILKILNII